MLFVEGKCLVFFSPVSPLSISVILLLRRKVRGAAFQWEKSEEHDCLSLYSSECWVGWLGYRVHVIDSLVDCLHLNSWFQFLLISNQNVICPHQCCVSPEALPQLDHCEPFRSTSHVIRQCDICKSCWAYFQNYYFALLPFSYFIWKISVLHNSGVSFFYNLQKSLFFKTVL